MEFARRRFVTACALLAALFAAAAGAQEIYAARVNGVGIPLPEVEAGFDEMLKEKGLHLLQVRDPAKVKRMKREVLDGLIDDELLWQEARKHKAIVGDREVDEAFAVAAKNFKGEEKLKLRLAQEGVTEADYRDRIRRSLSGQKYAQTAVARSVKLSDKEIRQFYKDNPDKFKRPEMVQARHILIGVAPDATEAQRAAAREKIEKILAQARSGTSFEELAREQSEDATKQWGGQLDPFPRGQTAPAFEEAAFRLKPGEISGVVTTPAGFHIILVEQHFPALVVSEKDARERIKEYLQGTRQQEAIKKLLEELRAAAKIEMLLPL